MTFKEKFEEKYQNGRKCNSEEEKWLYSIKCPYECKFENFDKRPINLCNKSNCKKCWNREYREESVSE